MIKKTALSALLAIALVGFVVHSTSAKSWFAQPITVHEWGVQSFDWQSATPQYAKDIPPFIYTDARPGAPMPITGPRVKDLPPDSGVRAKPILYFHLPASNFGESLVGVEMRFAQGHANAWWPQVNTYRTPAMTQNAVAPDFTAWKNAQTNRRWPNKDHPLPPVPDDERMELVWSRLTLSNTLTPPLKLAGENLPAGSWINQARNVNAAYVSNGAEAEKFLFYEGATHEQPDIALIPGVGDSGGPMPMSSGTFHIVNTSDQPLYNVFAIYHASGHTWVGYVSALAPISGPIPAGSSSSIASLEVPISEKFAAWTDDKSLASATTDRLLAALTEGSTLTSPVMMRDPADPQGPTSSATLYPDEAAALEKIWHKQFFDTPGLTVLYRQSPAALDADMPLNIYTDMFHYIRFARCGLVLNSNINTKEALFIYQSVIQAAHSGDIQGQLASLNALYKPHPVLTQSVLRYLQRTDPDPKHITTLIEQLGK